MDDYMIIGALVSVEIVEMTKCEPLNLLTDLHYWISSDNICDKGSWWSRNAISHSIIQ